jgi:hypothetical protein
MNRRDTNFADASRFRHRTSPIARICANLGADFGIRFDPLDVSQTRIEARSIVCGSSMAMPCKQVSRPPSHGSSGFDSPHPQARDAEFATHIRAVKA